jgi:hypothetical protein
LPNSSSDFLKIKSDFTKFSYFLNTCKGIFGWERLWVTGVGSSSSILSNSKILIEYPLASKAGQKKLANSQFFKFT